MAKIRLGALAGAVSGSIGSDVYSHNRYGAYVRMRSLNTNRRTPYQVVARNNLIAVSQEWRGLGADEQLAWAEWSAGNLVKDRLGDMQRLQPNAAYIRLNGELRAIGEGSYDTPPVEAPPVGIGGVTMTADIGAGDFEVAWTSGTLTASQRLAIWGCLLPHAGLEYRENKMRLLGASPDTQASPYDVQTMFADRFGSLLVGQIAVVRVYIISVASGLRSSSVELEAAITSTGP